jgi:hypothetical protein
MTKFGNVDFLSPLYRSLTKKAVSKDIDSIVPNSGMLSFHIPVSHINLEGH